MTGRDRSAASDTFADGSHRPLAGLDPARSRHNWTRTAVTVVDESILVGGPDGRVTAFDPGAETGQRWVSKAESGYVVSVAATDARVVLGSRGGDAGVAVRSLEHGACRWRHAAAQEVGTAADDSIFAQPHVVDVSVSSGGDTGDDVTVAAIRRYERTGDHQSWSSVVLGFDPDGGILWRHRVPGSPVTLDTHAGRVAVAYNRRPADGDGLVVLDAATGDELVSWDPPGPGERRVGDVAFAGDTGAIAVASHADKRGYLLDPNGTERWRVDLGTPRETDGETVYTYPTHVCVAGGTPVFVTGNTFAEQTRDPDARHPSEHTVVAVAGGEVTWTHGTGGFARDISVSGSRVAVPSAQHFRRRDADTHAVHVFDTDRGHLGDRSVSGIAAAAALADGTLGVIEEPVEYHDDGVERGGHRLHTWGLDTSRPGP